MSESIHNGIWASTQLRRYTKQQQQPPENGNRWATENLKCGRESFQTSRLHVNYVYYSDPCVSDWPRTRQVCQQNKHPCGSRCGRASQTARCRWFSPLRCWYATPDKSAAFGFRLCIIIYQRLVRGVTSRHRDTALSGCNVCWYNISVRCYRQGSTRYSSRLTTYLTPKSRQ